jgi:hypothetical protein
MLTSKMILSAAPGPGAPTVNFSGRWANELGSVMRLTVNGQQVTGDYSRPVSGGGGTVRGDLAGFVDGDLISFVVNWDGPGSLTAWTGQLVRDDNRDTIKTLWLLVMNVEDADEPTGLWQSTLVGTDEFTRE